MPDPHDAPSAETAATPAAGTSRKILEKMLDRLYVSLLSGPSLNCRPHNSRQRIDLTALDALDDLPASEALLALLGSGGADDADHPAGEAVINGSVPMPEGANAFSFGKSKADHEEAEGLSDEEAAERKRALAAWRAQKKLLTKLRNLSEDARTYAQDTGVEALMLGYPVLSIPPGAMGGGSRRILAPVAFAPVSLAVQGGTKQGLSVACTGQGVDRVVPNPALMAWVERETGKRLPDELFADDESVTPWQEIAALTRAVVEMLDLEGVDVDALLPEAARAEPEVDAAIEESELGPDTHALPELPAEVEELTTEGAGATEGEAGAAQPPVAASAPDTPDASALTEGEVAGTPTDAPDEEPAADADAFELVRIGRSDELPAGPAVMRAAVLGVFPASNQGLLRDTRQMIESPPKAGPVCAFIESGVVLGDAAQDREGVVPTAKRQPRPFDEERFVALADPCQGQTVRLARSHEGLVMHGPPGTGKSQTITNIIGDHLARGERVLFVCDKRTALDVVANRLEHLGLGPLCATVHDPKRDQRDLYMAVRKQLDELPDRKTHPRAEATVDKIDAELKAIHAELTTLHDALMIGEPDEEGREGEPSFHALVGRWLEIAAPDLGDEHLADATLAELESVEQPVAVVLERGEAIAFPTNPWGEAADAGAGALDGYLRRNAEETRRKFASCVEDARSADATLHEAIPPFDAEAALDQQAAARVKLHGQLQWVDEHADVSAAQRVAGLDASDTKRLRASLSDASAHFAAAETALETELWLTAKDDVPTLKAIAEDLGRLHGYTGALSKWYGFLLFGAKKRGKQALSGYGMPPGKENATRLTVFLEGLKARQLATVAHEQLTGTPTDAKVVDDATLRGTAEQYGGLLDTLSAADDAALSDPTRAALTDAAARATLVDGLHRSPPRAEALATLEASMAAQGLFDDAWLKRTAGYFRANHGAAETLGKLEARFDDVESVFRIHDALAALPEGFRAPVKAMLQASVSPADGRATLEKRVLAHTIDRRLAASPELVRIDPERLDQRMRRYRELEGDKRDKVRDAIEHAWVEKQKGRLLVGTGSRLNSLGASLRQRLYVRGSRAMRLRQMLKVGREAQYEDHQGDPLFDLCPVWLCSPETVAQVFPREPVFDTVIFDEASQCRLEEALPVLTRAKRVVIAGDPKQLPPTRFFEAGVSASDTGEINTEDDLFEAQQTEVEDLLGAALNLSVQETYLDVHYRSKNADLIEFSNRAFYRGRLQAIPGHPAGRTPYPPVLLKRVEDGLYEDRVNEPEGRAVVALVKELLKRADPPSVGIATFNLTQRELIMDLLADEAENDSDFARRLAKARERRGEGSFEGLFVKNLENVQGDERDVIIISTTYGPNAEGRFYRRFGPLAMAGGGRRLNVLVTRARREVHLVSSIPPEQYRHAENLPEGATPSGSWLLFAYLRFAEELDTAYREMTALHGEVDAGDGGGVPAAVRVYDVEPASAFPPAFAARAARAAGLSGDVFWGNEGFCVDVAAADPAKGAESTVGVLTDFARYEGSPDPVDWDVYRCGILEWQGWTLKRVWTPAYFRDPVRAVNTVATSVDALTSP